MRISDWSSDVCSSDLNDIQLQPFDIVLVNTSAGAAYGSADFLNKGCGMGEEATLFLTGQGVRVVGTDAWRSEERREGKSVSVRVDLGGSRLIKKKKHKQKQ